MASDVESRLKDKIIAYEKKIETRLLQQRYKVIILGLVFLLAILLLVVLIMTLMYLRVHHK